VKETVPVMPETICARALAISGAAGEELFRPIKNSLEFFTSFSRVTSPARSCVKKVDLGDPRLPV
jgi:hypothetical protein